MSRRPSARKAIALHYDTLNAPKVVASGQGALAQRILELAEAHGVPIREDAALADALEFIPIGEEIPEALYRAIAEVIAYVYWAAGKQPNA